MSLGKQARVLKKSQIEAVLGYLSKTRHARRKRAIFLLSEKAGLRAKEIDRVEVLLNELRKQWGGQ